MGTHRRLKFESFKKKEASDVHERLKFKVQQVWAQMLIAYPKNLRRNRVI